MQKCIIYTENCTISKKISVDHAPELSIYYTITIYHYFCKKIIFLEYIYVKMCLIYIPKRTKLHNLKKTLPQTQKNCPPPLGKFCIFFVTGYNTIFLEIS